MNLSTVKWADQEMTNWAWMLRLDSMTAFCGPVVPLEKKIMTGSSAVSARSPVSGSDGSRSPSRHVSAADICSSLHATVLTPNDDDAVTVSSLMITVYSDVTQRLMSNFVSSASGRKRSEKKQN